MLITKERFNELGLGCEKEDCSYYQNGECDGIDDPYEIAECVDNERIKEEMTEEEFFEYRHNNLKVRKN